MPVEPGSYKLSGTDVNLTRSVTLKAVKKNASLIVLYAGDYDPSGLYMSEHDLPDRLARYGGNHVTLKRIALKREHTDGR